MTKQQKITLSASRDIPFNKLMLSQSNVRHVKAGVSIEELAEDIARRTLLASITVRPVLDDSGAETGMYTIPAGGRRFRALELLVKQKRLNKTALVPCVVRMDGLAEEDSLAENILEAHLGQTWHPRAGSHVNRRTLTASLIDSRDHIAAKRRADLEPLLPQGTRIAFTGGLDSNDHAAIWTALDRVHAKHADMVLLHGGAPRGAERIAAAWADNRGVTQIVFKPDWMRHGKSAPFKRNDQLLDTLPIGLIVFPGSGITDNLADKARTMGIPLFDFRQKAAPPA